METQKPLKSAAHGRGDVFGAQLGLDVGVVELGDEGVRPRLAGVDGDVHVVLPVPLPPLQVAAPQMLCFKVVSTIATQVGCATCLDVGAPKLSIEDHQR